MKGAGCTLGKSVPSNGAGNKGTKCKFSYQRRLIEHVEGLPNFGTVSRFLFATYESVVQDEILPENGLDRPLGQNDRIEMAVFVLLQEQSDQIFLFLYQ